MNKAEHGEIAKRAYAIWEREGRPHGRDFEHWLDAEREMNAAAPTPPNRAQAAAAAAPKTARKTTRKPVKPQN